MNELTAIDWICMCILMFCGAWKLRELADTYGTKSANWIIKKIEGDK